MLAVEDETGNFGVYNVVLTRAGKTRKPLEARHLQISAQSA
jgi:hypothetical protein